MKRLAVREYFAGLTGSTFLLALSSLFADISTEMLYPVLPTFLTQTLKAGGSIVGLVDGFAQATQNIVQGFSGALSDKLRKHKSIALIGYLVAALAKPLMGLATGWPGLLGARLLDRVGAGTRSPPRDALIAASVHEKDRGRAFGLEGVGDNAGAFLGPLLAVRIAVRDARRHSHDILSGADSGLACILHGAFRLGGVGRGDCQGENRPKPAAVSRRVLEISVGDRVVQLREFQQRLSHSAHARQRHFPAIDHLDLRCI